MLLYVIKSCSQPLVYYLHVRVGVVHIPCQNSAKKLRGAKSSLPISINKNHITDSPISYNIGKRYHNYAVSSVALHIGLGCAFLGKKSLKNTLTLATSCTNNLRELGRLQKLLANVSPPSKLDLHHVFCGLIYVKSGCQWRMLPKKHPKWRNCHYYFSIWSEKKDDGSESILEQV